MFRANRLVNYWTQYAPVIRRNYDIFRESEKVFVKRLDTPIFLSFVGTGGYLGFKTGVNFYTNEQVNANERSGKKTVNIGGLCAFGLVGACSGAFAGFLGLMTYSTVGIIPFLGTGLIAWPTIRKSIKKIENATE